MLRFSVRVWKDHVHDDNDHFAILGRGTPSKSDILRATLCHSRRGLTAFLAAGSPAHLGKGVPDGSDPHAQSDHFFARKAVLSSRIARFRTGYIRCLDYMQATLESRLKDTNVRNQIAHLLVESVDSRRSKTDTESLCTLRPLNAS